MDSAAPCRLVIARANDPGRSSPSSSRAFQLSKEAPFLLGRCFRPRARAGTEDQDPSVRTAKASRDGVPGGQATGGRGRGGGDGVGKELVPDPPRGLRPYAKEEPRNGVALLFPKGVFFWKTCGNIYHHYK